MPVLVARFKPSDTQLEVDPKETVLAAALRQDYRINWGCDAGACLVCSAKLLSGKVLLKDEEVITPAGDVKEVLLCQAYLLENSEFEFTDIWPPGDFPIFHLSCQIVATTPQSNFNYPFTVTLRLPAGQRVERRIGQWLKIHYSNSPQTQLFKIMSTELAGGQAVQRNKEDLQRLVTFAVKHRNELFNRELEKGLVKVSLPYSNSQTQE